MKEKIKQHFSELFRPKLIDTFTNYSREQFFKDLIAGIIVGIIALPLCIAFGIASGVTPQQGLITGVIGGFMVSSLGGSRVQVGGPTGAFIVIVYGIVQQYGIGGLIASTFLAGLLLIAFGIAKLGSIIKFIPHSLVVGFTSGIAVVIFSSQIKDSLGLQMGSVPADFDEKWVAYYHHFSTINWIAAGLCVITMLVTFFFPKISTKIPGSLIAILITTIAAQMLKLPVETIGSKFGAITAGFPTPSVPDINIATIKGIIRPAFTIALLGGIESLLSAVVADGMIGGSHRSNTELIAQGISNIASAVFGGIPVTGAIARTAANVKNGGRTPIAGMVHALVLLIIMLFVGQLAAYIPMATLSGILIVVSFNMSEYPHFITIARGLRSDAIILMATFLLTVFVDLTVAIEIGMILAAFLFMRRMSQISHVKNLTEDSEIQDNNEDDPNATNKYTIPKEVEVFEINGPFFFGATYQFKEAIKNLRRKPKVLILRMRHVPVIDESGMFTLENIFHDMAAQKTTLVLSGVQPQVYEELENARLIDIFGSENVTDHFTKALKRTDDILNNTEVM